jgi:ribosomal protein S18 acetylase RimI-like enzyme
MSTRIRHAGPDDAQALAPLFDAYRAFFAKPDPAGSLTFITERLDKGDSALIVSDEGDRLSGFLQLYPLFSSWYATRIWFLSDLYVDERDRQRGLGKDLVAAAQAYARETTSRSIMVEIPHSEPHLVRFYESLAFQRDRTFDLYRCYLVE